MGENRLAPVIAGLLVVCLLGVCVLAGLGWFIGFNYFQQVEVTAVAGPFDAIETELAPTVPQEKEAEPLPPGERDNVLIIPASEPPTLDPHLSGDSNSAGYVVEIYSGLMAYTPQMELVPDLAESYDVSDDRTVYTFYLRENAAFHDGKKVTADDVKWSFERACDPRTGSTTADTYLGDIVGCRDKLRGKAKEVSGVRVVDDLTVEITIDGPRPYFLAKMSYPTAYVVDKENVEGGGKVWFYEPNGSGPFKLKEMDLGKGIVLEKNENYYRDPMPSLDEVRFEFIGGSAMTRYEQDELDVTFVGPTDIERVQDTTNPLNKELVVSEELSTYYIGFKTNQPPFDDVKVRQAFAYALDRERLVKILYKGSLSPTSLIVPPSMPDYDNSDLEVPGFDLDKALELIEESSYGDVADLPDITLYTSGAGGSASRLVEAVTASYKENLGVDIQIEQADWGTFLAELDRGDSSFQMYDLGWIADYPDPQDFLSVLFHSKSSQNHTGYSNPEVDELLDAADVEADEEKRMELYREAEQIIIEDTPWIPLYHNVDYWLVKPYVKGMTFPPMIVPKYQYVTLETE